MWEHIPDGYTCVFGDRLYVFGSHDKEGGDGFCELDYVSWSCPVDDLSDWRREGVIYRKDSDPYNKDCLPLFAPDVVQGRDGKFYLYYSVKFQDSINVAVCDTPAGSTGGSGTSPRLIERASATQRRHTAYRESAL